MRIRVVHDPGEPLYASRTVCSLDDAGSTALGQCSQRISIAASVSGAETPSVPRTCLDGSNASLTVTCESYTLSLRTAIISNARQADFSCRLPLGHWV